MSNERQTSRRISWRWIVGGVILLVFIAGIFGNGGSSHSTAQDTPRSTPSANVTGQLPTIQYVGQTTDVSLTVKDMGSRLPHLVVDVGGCKDHWVLDSISSDKGSGQKTSGGDYYDFGPIGPGMTWHGTLTITPKDAGNHDCDIGVYGDLDESTGIPNGDPLGLLKGAVAINP